MAQSSIWKWVFWTTSLLIALSSLRFLIAPMDLVMDHMLHYLPGASAAIFGHMIFGPAALALAPFQFWASLRKTRPRLHRAMGYGYAVSVALSALCALLMLPHFQGAPWVAAGFAALAVLWPAFTARAIAAARARDFAAHRRWMARSAALTFAAVSLRIIMAPLMALGWSVQETYQITAWGSWLLNLAVLEWATRRRA